MRIILDVSTGTDNRIEGTARWMNREKPIHFSGWLALMRLFEDAQRDLPDVAHYGGINNDGINNDGTHSDGTHNGADHSGAAFPGPPDFPSERPLAAGPDP